MTEYSPTVETAREYYNSEDADNFYYTVWGGEDIHVGLYQSDSEPIADASRRTVRRMAEKIKNLGPESYVIDVGGGYAGSMRYLSQQFGCKTVSLNLSEVENERARERNREQGLDKLVEVVDGDFTSLPYDDQTFDVVWSQDAFLHSGDREQVFREAVRVLKPGGEFIFTDPMQADDCPEGVIDPILERIHLDTLGSPAFYRQQAAQHGLEEVEFEDLSHQLTNHYSRVLRELENRDADIRDKHVSGEYIDRMKKGLGHWVEGGKNGHLAWGILHFRKK